MTSDPSTAAPPAGWYADPAGRRAHRWWDGERWTTFASSHGLLRDERMDGVVGPPPPGPVAPPPACTCPPDHDPEEPATGTSATAPDEVARDEVAPGEVDPDEVDDAPAAGPGDGEVPSAAPAAPAEPAARPAPPIGLAPRPLLAAFLGCLRDGLRLTGRTDRVTFWRFYVVCSLLTVVPLGVSTGLDLLRGPTREQLLLGRWGLRLAVLLAVPLVTAVVRRLRDAGQPAWTPLLLLIPVLGWLSLVVLLLQPSRPRSSTPATATAAVDEDTGAGRGPDGASAVAADLAERQPA